MNQKLKTKIAQIFDVSFTSEMSDKDILQDLDRRGKLDTKKLLDTIFVLIDEVDKITERLNTPLEIQAPKKTQKPSKK